MNFTNQDSFQVTSHDPHPDTGKVTVEPYGSNGRSNQQVYPCQPQQRRRVADGPVGIGGWLALVAFGTVMGTLGSIVEVIRTGGLVSWLDLGIMAWTSYLLFTRRRSFPTWSIGALLFDTLTGIIVASSPEFAEIPNQFLTVFLFLRPAIWIPYLLTSKRVKNTFVN